MAYTSLEDALKNYVIEPLDSNLYEIAQLSEDELNSKLKIYFESDLLDLTLEEREEKINELVSQIHEQLDAVSDYADDLADEIESLNKAGEISQARSDQRLLDDLQSFLEGSGVGLSDLSTTIPTELYRLGGLIVESEEDEYFLYDKTSSNALYGGEVVRYNLTATIQDSELTPEETNYADTNDDGVPDVDINGDGTIDAKDMVEEVTPYDLSGQEFYIELNPGDKIISAVYDNSTQMFSFEIETADRTIDNEDGTTQEITSKTFMLEVKVEDLEASHIIFQGEDYASQDVFKDLDHEALAILYDQAPVTSLLQTLYPDNNTPTIDAQLAALAGYTECIESIPDAVNTLNSAFATTENSFSLPSDANEIIADLYNAVFDNTLLNSYSEFSADEAIANFYAILDQYSDTEQAALTMAFCLSFIQTDPDQFTEFMGTEIWNLQDRIDVYASEDGSTNISMIEKAMHTIIEDATGFGKYSGDGSQGNLFTIGTAYATETGSEGAWKDHEENIAALQFCIDNGFDTTGNFATVITFEQGLIDGALSTTDTLNLQNDLGSIALNELYWDWQIDLDQRDWTNAVTYLSNHLVDKDGNLVDNPLQVFKDCLNKFFKKNGDWTVGADNFASTFLYACDMSGSSGLSALMEGPYGKDIAKYLWNVTENGGTTPKFYEEAKRYKNSIV